VYEPRTARRPSSAERWLLPVLAGILFLLALALSLALLLEPR
jgi:hypothetical protein